MGIVFRRTRGRRSGGMVENEEVDFGGEKSKVKERPRAEGPMVAGGDVAVADDGPAIGVTGGRLKIGNVGARTTTEGDRRARSWTSSPGLLLGDMINAEGKGERGARGGSVVRRGTLGRVGFSEGMELSPLEVVDPEAFKSLLFSVFTTLIDEGSSSLARAAIASKPGREWSSSPSNDEEPLPAAPSSEEFLMELP